MHNGVRQGAILSALAYCFYCEELFTLLEKRRSGCWINGYFMGLMGYSDDNICIAPSLNALQDMIKTCEEFALSHNLKFSTDIDPKKCKTKTMAFLKKERELPNLYLCGNPLPWTEKCKHLGVNLENKINGCEYDIRVKKASYVTKNIELNQEFAWAHPATKVKVNNIYNSHQYGSVLWNLFGKGSQSIESSYNRSVKVMLDLPWATHRSLIQPLTGETHVKLVLLKRYLIFLEKMKNSGKSPLVMLLNEAKKDVRSVTGSNLRNIMILAGKSSIEDVTVEDVDTIPYFNLSEDEHWKVDSIKEIIDVKAGNLDVPGFDLEELETILNHLCTE